MSADDRSRRKALLVSRSALERMQLALLVHEIRDRVAPPAARGVRSAGTAGRVAAAMIAVGLPLLGRQRLGRWLRYGSMALTALRVARQWRGPGGR
ncbi:MAG: hypothetical protein WCK28_20160 [Burkholderiales bacterium]|jgi:hypothetical protein